jgi:hypothetical protein
MIGVLWDVLRVLKMKFWNWLASEKLRTILIILDCLPECIMVHLVWSNTVHEYVGIIITSIQCTDFRSHKTQFWIHLWKLFEYKIVGSKTVAKHRVCCSVKAKNVMFFVSMPWGHKGGVWIHLHSFLTSALDRGERSTWQPGWFTSREGPQYPLHMRQVGSKNWLGVWRRAKSHTSPGNWTLYFPACSPVAVLVGCFQLLRTDILGLNCVATEVVNSGMVGSLYTFCSTCVYIQNTVQLIWKLFDSQVTKFVGSFEWWLIPSKCFLIFMLVKKCPLFMGPEQISWTPQLCVCACLCVS